MNKKSAVITGITGQDGSYMAEILLDKKYQVIAVVRDKKKLGNATFLKSKVKFVVGDVTNKKFIQGVVRKYRPTEVYNFAAVSTVFEPYKDFSLVYELNAMSPVYLLEAIISYSPKTKFFQASSAEMFDRTNSEPKNENSKFAPVNPYGFAKLLVHELIGKLRSQKKIFAVSGILFNHESPRRGKNFVTRKVTTEIALIKLGKQKQILVGNLDAKRDWGYALEYMEGAWKAMQSKTGDDYVFATGKLHTTRELIVYAAKALDIEITWSGNGLDEVGTDNDGNVIVKVDKTFYREENKNFYGDISKIKQVLNWEPKTTFKELIELMVKEDYNRLKK